jgi:hypothetical protein
MVHQQKAFPGNTDVAKNPAFPDTDVADTTKEREKCVSQKGGK